MPTLYESQLAELEDIRGREARYRALSAQLAASVKPDGTRMADAEFEELQSLQNALAGDAKRLLSMIDQLQTPDWRS